MKRIILTLIIALIMSLSLTSCGHRFTHYPDEPIDTTWTLEDIHKHLWRNAYIFEGDITDTIPANTEEYSIQTIKHMYCYHRGDSLQYWTSSKLFRNNIYDKEITIKAIEIADTIIIKEIWQDDGEDLFDIYDIHPTKIIPDDERY